MYLGESFHPGLIFEGTDRRVQCSALGYARTLFVIARLGKKTSKGQIL
jgi:hypothetical protein